MRKPKLVPSNPARMHKNALDPESINSRLYRQLSVLLEDMEREGSDGEYSVRDRITVLVAIARIQTLFMGLRKEKGGDENVGSAVRKYASAFEKNAVDKREAVAEPDDDDTYGIGITDLRDDDPAA